MQGHNDFRRELMSRLLAFRPTVEPPKQSVTSRCGPRAGLTAEYTGRPRKSFGPFPFGGAGAVAGAGVGVGVAKAGFGTGALAGMGVASAGIGVGMPIILPFTLVGGAIGVAAHLGRRKSSARLEAERMQVYRRELCEHMRGFNPSAPWPDEEVDVEVPESGLKASWRPL